jgi:hypothetical protein
MTSARTPTLSRSLVLIGVAAFSTFCFHKPNQYDPTQDPALFPGAQGGTGGGAGPPGNPDAPPPTMPSARDGGPSSVTLDAHDAALAEDAYGSTPQSELTVAVVGSGAGNVVDLDSSAKLWCRPTCFPTDQSPSCGGVCSARYPKGAKVRLGTITPAPAVLSQWSGACAGAGECVVDMSVDRRIEARFDLDGVTNLVSVEPFPQSGLFVLREGTLYVALIIAKTGTYWGQALAVEQGSSAYLAALDSAGRARWLRPYGPAVALYEMVSTTSGDLMFSGSSNNLLVVKHKTNEGSFMPLPAQISLSQTYEVSLAKTGYLVKESTFDSMRGTLRSLTVYDVDGRRTRGPFGTAPEASLGYFDVAYLLPDGGILLDGDHKIDSSGAFVWDGGVRGQFTVDDAGDIYVTGRLAGPMTIGGVDLRSESGDGIFIVKQSGATGRPIWVRSADRVRAGRLSVAGTDLYLGATAASRDPVVLPGYSAGRVSGTGLVVRFDAASGVPTWATGVDGEVRAIAAGTDSVAVQTDQPSRLFRFRK